MRKTNNEWLSEKLSSLLGWAKELPEDGPVTKYRYFTALKLIAVSFYSSVFVRVVKGQTEQPKVGAVYVDLLAGTGLVSIKDASSPTYLAGSPICAAFAEKEFDYIVCVESDRDKCDALERRLAKVRTAEFDIIRGDCNDKIDEVISKIKSKYTNPIVLVFVDPEAFEVKFKTLMCLGEAFEKCDFMIHVNSGAVKREEGKVIKESHNASPRVLEEYYDTPALDIFENLATMSPEQQYVNFVKEKMGKQIGNTIKIRNTKHHTAYHILCYTRKTQGGSGYADSIETLKRRLEVWNADSVRRQIEILNNKQKTLDRKPGLEEYFE